MSEEEARELLTKFAAKHRIVFDDDGECGFGRPCVGLRHGDNWLSYSPCRSNEYEPIPELDSPGARPPDGVDAYHKHECFAVLGHGPEAIIQLARWVESMESQGAVEVVDYPTGATGIQALLSGVRGHCIVVHAPQEAPQ